MKKRKRIKDTNKAKIVREGEKERINIRKNERRRFKDM